MSALRLAALSLAIVGATACRGNNPEIAYAYTVPTGGDADRGKALIQQFDCGSCHTIPGIRGANGLVGPPLLWFARRTFIAGILPNSPANLTTWIRAPRSIEPRTAMPTLGLSEDQAQDIAAYLYTLR